VINSFLGDSAISDMFGLGLPRGSLMGNQSTIGSSSYHNYQYSSYDQMQGSSSQQREVMLCTGIYAWAYNLFQYENLEFLMKSLKIMRSLLRRTWVGL